MMMIRRIAIVVALLLLSFAVSSAEASVAACKIVASAETLCVDGDGVATDERSIVSMSCQPMLSVTMGGGAFYSVNLAVRTLHRTVRTAERCVHNGRVMSAIDSTMSASRYGLYNHRILFVSHARLHYLNRLVRLII